MRNILGLVLLTCLLAGCGHSNSPPPSPPLFSGGLAPSAFQITHGSIKGSGASFTFPVGEPANSWVSYIEAPLTVRLTGAQSMTVGYTVTGTGNFQCTSCAPGAPTTIRLLLHRADDDMSCHGAYSYYRWFSQPQALAAGTGTLTVPFVMSSWIPCMGPPDEVGFVSALTNVGTVGVCFGGGDFACHGVSSDGSSFKLDSANIQ